MAAGGAEGKQEAGSSQQQPLPLLPPPLGREAGGQGGEERAGQAYTSMLASPKSVLAPGHRLPMKGSIMSLSCCRVPALLSAGAAGPPRARPHRRKGKRVLKAAPPTRAASRRELRRRRRDFRTVTGEDARRRSRRRPCRPPRPFLQCAPARAQAGPRSSAAAPGARSGGPGAAAPQIPPFLDSEKEVRVCY